MIVDGIDAIAELEDFSMKVYENEEKQGFVKEEERAEENEKIAKEASRREATGRRAPRRKKLMNYRRTFK